MKSMRKLLLIGLLFSICGISHADINVTEGSGKTVKTTTSGGKEIQWIQIDASSNAVSNNGTFPVQASASGVWETTSTIRLGGSVLSSANPLPVQTTGQVTINGTVNSKVQDNSGNGITSTANALDVNLKSGSIANTTFGATESGVWETTTTLRLGGSVLSSSNPLPVQSTGTTTVNVAQVGGIALLLGNNTMANSVPVTMASNQTQFAVMGSTSVANSAGTQIVFVSTFANVSASQTNQALVGTIASTKICVHQLSSVAGGTATNLTFTSSGGSSISPLYANAANGGEILPWSPIPWFCSVSGEGLGATTGTGSTTGILAVYGKE